MKSTDIPYKFGVPWAANASAGFSNPIPPTAPGALASQSLGFPPITASPIAAGGVPPNIADFNGALNYLTLWARWEQGGGPVFYDGAFATSTNGYARGAILASATSFGKVWLSTVDNNKTNPDTGGTNWISEAIAALGYTPVQQGGGAGQGTNKVYLGWDAGAELPRIQVDNTDLGDVAMMTGFASLVNTGNDTPGWQKIAGGLILQWQSKAIATQTVVTLSFPLAFPNAVFGVWASLGVGIPATTNSTGVSAQAINLGQFWAVVPTAVVGTIGCWFFSVGW